MAEMRLRLIDWRRVRKGKLYGFAELELQPIGLLLHQVPVLMNEKSGPWACMPTKPRLDGDGRQMRRLTGRRAMSRCAPGRRCGARVSSALRSSSWCGASTRRTSIERLTTVPELVKIGTVEASNRGAGP
jgi:hypothetical protein